MPTSKQALAEAYCAIGHLTAAVSTVTNKYSKEVLTNKLCAAQCTECDYEENEAEYDDADDGPRSDAVSMPSLAANSSMDGSGSDGVSEAEVVEEQEQALTAARVGRPPKAQRNTTTSRALQGQRADKATMDAKRADEREQKRLEAGRAKAAEEKKQASLARKQAREQKGAARKEQPTPEEDADAALMAELVAALGHEIAEVLQGVLACDLRKEVHGMAQMFEVTRFMVAVHGWDPRSVLPTLCRRSCRWAHTRWGRR